MSRSYIRNLSHAYQVDIADIKIGCGKDIFRSEFRGAQGPSPLPLFPCIFEKNGQPSLERVF